MIHMPGNVCICDDCMHRTMDMVNAMQVSGVLDNPDFQRQLAEFERQMFIQKPTASKKVQLLMHLSLL